MFDMKTGYLFGDAGKLGSIFILAGLFAWSSPWLFDPGISMIRIIVVGSAAVFIGMALRMNFQGLEIDVKTN